MRPLVGTMAIPDDVSPNLPDRAAVADTRAMLAAIVESSEDAIVSKDLNGVITSWNPAAEQLYGYTAGEVIGQPISILFPQNRPDELSGIMGRLRRGERIKHFETTRIRKDGSTVDVSISLSPVHDEHGQIAGVAGIGREITDRRQAERERDALLVRERAAREQLDTILGGIADGVVVQREDGTFIYANDAAARMAGFDSAEEYLRASPFEMSRRLAVMDEDGQPFPLDLLPARRAFRGEESPEMVVRFRRPDTNEVRWSRTQARIVRGADDEPLAISIFTDMTDEMRARDRLRFLAEAGAQLAGSLDVDESLESLVQVASSTLADWAAVILIEEDGTVQRIATAHRDPAKTPFVREIHTRQLSHASGAALLWQAIQRGEALMLPVVTDEMLVQSARNEEHLRRLRALEMSSLLYAPLISRGRVQGVLALFMSGTGRRFGEEDRAIAIEMARRASLALENARLYREAHDAVHARDEFLSIASHELRTPVTAISGVAQMALRSKQRGTLDDARLTRALDQLIRGSQRLATLTEDLLDVSRLQTGRFELRPEHLDLPVFVTDFVDRFSAQLDEGHRVTLDVGAGPLMVHADPARLEQVLSNLLSNAVKYTPGGGEIGVSVSLDGARSLVAVQDNGIGLPAGSDASIFEPFGRAPNATHRQIAGLGLGLYICRQIMERHGGEIWATSPGDNHGSTFTFCLPTSIRHESVG